MPHGNILFQEIALEIHDVDLLEMKDRGCQSGVGLADSEGISDELHRACTATGNDGDIDDFIDLAVEFIVESCLGAVGIHRSDEKLARSSLIYFSGPFNSIDTGIIPAPMDKNIPVIPRDTFGIDRDNNTLRAKTFGSLIDKRGTINGC